MAEVAIQGDDQKSQQEEKAVPTFDYNQVKE